MKVKAEMLGIELLDLGCFYEQEGVPNVRVHEVPQVSNSYVLWRKKSEVRVYIYNVHIIRFFKV